MVSRAYIRVSLTEDGRTPKWELVFEGETIMEFKSRNELVDFTAQCVSALRWEKC